MNITIERTDLESDGSGKVALWLARRAAGEVPLERYHARILSGGVVSGAPMVALIEIDSRTSEDRVAILKAVLAGTRLDIEVEQRIYVGALLGSDPTKTLVQIELGPLPIGPFEIAVRDTKLHFAELGHPENASDPIVTHHPLELEILPAPC